LDEKGHLCFSECSDKTTEKEHKMTDITMALKELLRKHELDIDSDFLREGVQMMMQMLSELEASEQIGAGVYERTPA
jgi:transposase-like protein